MDFTTINSIRYREKFMSSRRFVTGKIPMLRNALAIFAAILILTACGGGADFYSEGGNLISCDSPWASPDHCDDGSGGGTVGVLPTCDGNETGIIDACGEAISALDLHDPVYMSLTGLAVNTRHTIVITDPSAAEITPAGGLVATSDGDGNINKVVIVQNMDPAAELGDYTVSVDEQAVPTGTPQTLTYTVENRSRVECVNNADTPQASFLAGDTVFARVTKNDGTLADGDYDVYVVSDLQKPLANGGLISGTPSTVTVASGSGTVSLGTHSLGAYDVVVDVNGNGIFNQGTDLISRHNRLLPCFSVQAPNSGLAMVEQIASDKNGNKREIFDPDANVEAIRDIQAYVTPMERSTVQQPGSVNTYLVNHQVVWANGDPLTDVAGGAKISPVQDDSNSEAPWILAPFSSLAALGGTTCYDVVVDTNGNGQFDVGIDYVDNEDHLGNNTCGVRVSTSGCTNVAITSHSDGDTTTDTAITLTGTVGGSPSAVYITNASGEQSNTIAVTLSAGAYSVNMPLFNGDNHITVSAIYADNSSCSKTITITSLTELALFRAQLTWDGDTDMDLHVVNPGGSYYNPSGAATDSSGDCYYGNCNVGLAGTGSNSIDWGDTGEDDDPKLDVDCISCGNGIENIWMEQINEDGDYKVYVDAYSGTETNVTVTIFILGTAVGQVNCGSMQAGTATDSCFVGTIHWSGGTSGIGSFTPDGSKASDF